jgi:phosphoenolpyruvate-protein kinase (PTS system EI component)
MTAIFEDSWKQRQSDAIADALHELLSDPSMEQGVEDAVKAIDSAIDAWLDYFDSEKEKWHQLKTRLRR